MSKDTAKFRRGFTKAYLAEFQRYLASEQESALSAGYELGRQASAAGLGVLDVAKIHQAALLASAPAHSKNAPALPWISGETFLMEVLSPFEVSHRGFKEANFRLRQVIETLEERTANLAATNQKLQLEFKARIEMEEMWKRYEAIVNNSKDFMTLVNAAFRYEAANDAYCQAHGKTREQIVGRTVAELWGKKIFERLIRENLVKCFEGHDAHYQAWFSLPALGHHCFDVSCFPYRGAGKVTHAIVVTRDITESKRAQEALVLSERHYRELFDEARAMEEALRNLSNRVVHTQEEERKRISRELHDEFGQALTAVNVTMAILRKSANPGPDSLLAKKFADAQRLLEHTQEAIHRFSRELRPAMLDDLGLRPALRAYIHAFAERTCLRVSFQAETAVEALTIEQKTVIYRVAQESLNNVAKHAKASLVSVTLKKFKAKIRLRIEDNGCSFSPDGPKGNRLGLLGMRERVRLINGVFDLRAAPGKGTTVQVDIPIKAEGLSKP